MPKLPQVDRMAGPSPTLPDAAGIERSTEIAAGAVRRHGAAEQQMLGQVMGQVEGYRAERQEQLEGERAEKQQQLEKYRAEQQQAHDVISGDRMLGEIAVGAKRIIDKAQVEGDVSNLDFAGKVKADVDRMARDILEGQSRAGVSRMGMARITSQAAGILAKADMEVLAFQTAQTAGLLKMGVKERIRRFGLDVYAEPAMRQAVEDSFSTYMDDVRSTMFPLQWAELKEFGVKAFHSMAVFGLAVQGDVDLVREALQSALGSGEFDQKPMEELSRKANAVIDKQLNVMVEDFHERMALGRGDPAVHRIEAGLLREKARGRNVYSASAYRADLTKLVAMEEAMTKISTRAARAQVFSDTNRKVSPTSETERQDSNWLWAGRSGQPNFPDVFTPPWDKAVRSHLVRFGHVPNAVVDHYTNAVTHPDAKVQMWASKSFFRTSQQPGMRGVLHTGFHLQDEAVAKLMSLHQYAENAEDAVALYDKYALPPVTDEERGVREHFATKWSSKGGMDRVMAGLSAEFAEQKDDQMEMSLKVPFLPFGWDINLASPLERFPAVGFGNRQEADSARRIMADESAAGRTGWTPALALAEATLRAEATYMVTSGNEKAAIYAGSSVFGEINFDWFTDFPNWGRGIASYTYGGDGPDMVERRNFIGALQIKYRKQLDEAGLLRGGKMEFVPDYSQDKTRGGRSLIRDGNRRWPQYRIRVYGYVGEGDDAMPAIGGTFLVNKEGEYLYWSPMDDLGSRNLLGNGGEWTMDPTMKEIYGPGGPYQSVVFASEETPEVAAWNMSGHVPDEPSEKDETGAASMQLLGGPEQFGVGE